MNWITTNIRFPEDLYMELKMEAARKRTSVAEIVRKRVSIITKKDIKNKPQKLLNSLDKFARKMANKYKGVNLTKALIEMRYEQ